MPGDKFKRVAAGEGLNISAATWNALLENAETASRNAFNNTSDLKSPRGVQSGLLVRVKNDSGADVDQFCPLMLDGGSVFNSEGSDNHQYSFKNTPVLIGEEPVDNPEAAFVVTQEPIADGEIGLCCLFGMTVVNIDMTHADHTHATLKDADATELTSAMFGHRIYSVLSGTGAKLAYICLGAESCNPYKGVATELIEPNTSGTFKFATGDFGTLTGIGVNFTGKYLADADSGDIADEAELFVSRVQGEWILTPVECPEE